MYTFLIIVHVLVCIVLTIIILLQSSKGGGLAGVFGGGGGAGGMGAIFGGRGAASFLSKLTTILAIIFMGISLILGLITGGGGSNAGIVSQERSRGTISNVLPTVPTTGEIEELPIAPPAQNENEAQPPDEN